MDNAESSAKPWTKDLEDMVREQHQKGFGAEEHDTNCGLVGIIVTVLATGKINVEGMMLCGIPADFPTLDREKLTHAFNEHVIPDLEEQTKKAQELAKRQQKQG